LRTARVCVLIASLGGVALTVVVLRAEQTRCAAAVLDGESQWVRERREWWSLQTRAARLRAPQRIRERLDDLPVEPFDPVPEGQGRSPVAKLAADRRGR